MQSGSLYIISTVFFSFPIAELKIQKEERSPQPMLSLFLFFFSIFLRMQREQHKKRNIIAENKIRWEYDTNH